MSRFKTTKALLFALQMSSLLASSACDLNLDFGDDKDDEGEVSEGSTDDGSEDGSVAVAYANDAGSGQACGAEVYADAGAAVGDDICTELDGDGGIVERSCPSDSAGPGFEEASP